MVEFRCHLSGRGKVKPRFAFVRRWEGVLAVVGLCALLGSAALLPRATAWAGESSYTEMLRRQAKEWEKQEQEEVQRKAMWQKRLERKRSAVEKARADVREARTGRLRARDGGYAGVGRSEWTRRWRKAQTALEAAEKGLETLPEEARRAGVPPGWLRDARNSQPEEESSSPS